jgi:hypothetical protein
MHISCNSEVWPLKVHGNEAIYGSIIFSNDNKSAFIKFLCKLN